MFDIVPANKQIVPSNNPQQVPQQLQPQQPPSVMPQMGSLFGQLLPRPENDLTDQRDSMTEVTQPDGTVIRHAERYSWFKAKRQG